MKVWMIMILLAVLLLCVWLFMKLIEKDPDKSIEKEKKKYFPASLKPPEESDQKNLQNK